MAEGFRDAIVETCLQAELDGSNNRVLAERLLEVLILPASELQEVFEVVDDYVDPDDVAETLLALYDMEDDE